VFESTVYPGVTEDICGPLLATGSGLRQGVDFELGYSPERINPGDKLHTIDRITKIIAGQSAKGVERLRALYGPVTGDRLFVAADIRTAEAAKAIENAQRDINIAFVNEIAMICGRLGLSAQDVLAAARTKWNFLDFTPGLVGGHCVAVDPYYLAQCAQDAGHEPEIILAGRRINDQMPLWIAERLDALLPRAARVLVLGLTFKENVPDLRNTRVIDLIQGLTRAGHEVVVHDPLADPAEAKAHYGVTLAPEFPLEAFDCLLGAVAHKSFRELTTQDLAARLKPNGLLADLRGMWRDRVLPDGVRRWAL
jgi:UDP-N-acetyl-D-galactosamine dehydrogenase